MIFQRPAIKKVAGTGADLNVDLGFRPRFAVVANVTQLSFGFITDTMEQSGGVLLDDSGVGDVDNLPQYSVQLLEFDVEPNSGSFKLSHGDHETAELAFDAADSDVETALQALEGLEAATVSGDFANGFTISLIDVVNPQPIEVSVNGLYFVSVQTVEFSAEPASGAFTLEYGAEETASIAWDDDAAAVQVALRAIEGLEEVTVSGDFANGFEVTFHGVDGNATDLVEGENTLEDIVPAAVTITITETDEGSGLVEPAVSETSSGLSLQPQGISIGVNPALNTASDVIYVFGLK